MPYETTRYDSRASGAEDPASGRSRHEAGGRRRTRSKKYPRRPAATITTLTAATGKVLTEFVGFRPTDLGHLKLRLSPNKRQHYTTMQKVAMMLG